MPESKAEEAGVATDSAASDIAARIADQNLEVEVRDCGPFEHRSLITFDRHSPNE